MNAPEKFTSKITLKGTLMKIQKRVSI